MSYKKHKSHKDSKRSDKKFDKSRKIKNKLEQNHPNPLYERGNKTIVPK